MKILRRVRESVDDPVRSENHGIRSFCSISTDVKIVNNYCRRPINQNSVEIHHICLIKILLLLVARELFVYFKYYFY